MRGRLFIAGVGPDTPLGDALDVLTVIVMDTPGEALKKWRTGIDRVVAAAQIRASAAKSATGKPDRATWGLAPGQIEQTRRFMANMGAGG